MDNYNVIYGRYMYTIRAIQEAEREGTFKDLPDKLLEIDDLVTKIFDSTEPPEKETKEFKDYIIKTGSVPLPTDEQIEDFAKTLHNRGKKGYRGNYFHGYHFFIDPAAGQSGYGYFEIPKFESLSGGYCRNISPKNPNENPNSRDEYLSRFGYIDFTHLINDGKLEDQILAFSLDKEMTYADLEKTELFIPVPREITRLVRLVKYEAGFSYGNKMRPFTWIEQIHKMVEVVKAGREKYAA